MFDFRYHALSLAAVLLSLVIGLLLGVAIGDQGLVSSAETRIRDSLRSDVRDAQDEADDLRDELAERDRFSEDVYPLLVGGQLQAAEIGVVFLGRPSEQIVDHVRDALQPSGGDLAYVAVVREPLNLGGIAGRADGTRYSVLENGPEELVDAFGQRMGIQLVEGGRLVRRVRQPLFDSLTGRLADVDGLVLVRNPAELDGEEAAQVAAFERGLVEGAKDTDVPVVGIEQTNTSPSQIGWYRDREITSVDNVDQVAGRASLVFALAGADGRFGVKGSADALLPEIAGGAGQP
jgi:hypothetical protein